MNEQKSIDEYKKLKGTKTAIFEGMKALNNWKTGKAVTEIEYDQAVKEFETSPVNGIKEAKG